MLSFPPSCEEMNLLIGPERYNIWNDVCTMIDSLYDMESQWNSGGKAWTYEYKFRRGGKTLCALYAKKDCAGLMIIFGKDERDKFEAERQNFFVKVQRMYDEAKTYHDGKWVMFELYDPSMLGDFSKLLAIKRKPNKKPLSKS